MIDGFRYGFIGHAEGSLVVGVVMMTVLDVALVVLCHQLIARGYKLKGLITPRRASPRSDRPPPPLRG